MLKNTQRSLSILIRFKKIITDHFNEYFIKVGSSLANNIKSHADPLMYVQQNTINIHKISMIEIQSVISSITNSAVDFDEIPASIMKQLVNYYDEPLTHLVNNSIMEGYFPEELRLARVLPILKSADEQLV